MMRRFLRNKFVKPCLILIFALSLTVCEVEEQWVELYVINNSSYTINITVRKREVDPNGDPWIRPIHTASGITPGDTMRYNGGSGNFRVIVTALPSNTEFHFPRGGNTLSSMSGRVWLDFDGNQLIRLID